MYDFCLYFHCSDLWNRHDSWSTNHYAFGVNAHFKGIAGVPRASLVILATCSMFGIPPEGMP